MPHFFNSLRQACYRKGLKVNKAQAEQLAQQLGCTIDNATSEQISEAIKILESQIVVREISNLVVDEAKNVGLELSTADVSELATTIQDAQKQNEDNLTQLELVKQAIFQYLDRQQEKVENTFTRFQNDVAVRQEEYSNIINDKLNSVMANAASNQQEIDTTFKKKCQQLAAIFQ